MNHSLQSSSIPPELVASVVSQVLETAAFAFAEPVDKADLEQAMNDSEELFFVASIQCSGDLQGRLTLVIPHGLCCVLTSDILGEDIEDISDDQAADTLGELANIVAGQLATHRLGDHAMVSLQPPQHERTNRSMWDQLLPLPTSVPLMIDDEPMLAIFTTDQFE